MNNNGHKAFDIDVRIIYGLFVLCVLIPLIKPIGLPLTITDSTRDAHDFTASIPADSVVLYSIEIGPSNEAENLPQAVAMLQHSAMLGHKILMVTFDPSAGPYLDRIAENVLEPTGLVYGEDFVIFPYRAGGESAVAALGEDMRGLYENDAYGNKLSSLSIMDKIDSIKDVALCQVYGSGDQASYYMRHVQAKFGTPVNVGTVAVGITLYGPYYASGQLSGMLIGQAGAAEYEALINMPGKGTAAMDAQSIGHMYMALLVLVGNIIYFGDKRRAAKEATNE